MAAALARLVVFFHSAPPMRESFTGRSSPPAMYFDTRSSCVARNVQAVRPGVTYFNVVLFDAVHRQLEDTGKAADAVVLVHHKIADREIGAGAELFAVCHGAAALAASQRARGDLRIGQHGKVRLRRFKTRGESAHRDGGPSLRRQSAVREAAQRRYAVSLEHRGEYVRSSLVRGEHHDAEIVFKYRCTSASAVSALPP